MKRHIDNVKFHLQTPRYGATSICFEEIYSKQVFVATDRNGDLDQSAQIDVQWM